MKPLGDHWDGPPSGANAGKELRILFIEDQLQDLQLSVNVLKKAGFNFKYEHAQTEQELDALLQTERFDIVLCDKHLPGWDTKEAIQRVKGHIADIPVILLSGSTSHEEALKHIQDGAADYLLKDHLVRLPFAVSRALHEKAEHQRRIQAETELKANESRYRSLVDNSYDAVVIIDRNGTFTYVSKSFERISGYLAKELLNTGRLSLTCPEDVERSNNSLEESLRRPGIPVHAQLRLKRKDGGVVWLDVVRTNHLDDENVQGVICNVRDITAEKLAVEKIIQSESLFRSMIENAPVGIFRTSDSSDHFLDANPACVSMLGYSTLEELRKVNLSTGVYYDPTMREKILDARQGENRGAKFTWIVDWKRKDGSKITVKLVGSRIINP